MSFIPWHSGAPCGQSTLPIVLAQSVPRRTCKCTLCSLAKRQYTHNDAETTCARLHLSFALTSTDDQVHFIIMPDFVLCFFLLFSIFGTQTKSGQFDFALNAGFWYYLQPPASLCGRGGIHTFCKPWRSLNSRVQTNPLNQTLTSCVRSFMLVWMEFLLLLLLSKTSNFKEL